MSQMVKKFNLKIPPKIQFFEYFNSDFFIELRSIRSIILQKLARFQAFSQIIQTKCQIFVFGIPCKYKGKNQNSAPNNFCPFRVSNFVPSLVEIVQKLKEEMQFENMVKFLVFGIPCRYKGKNQNSASYNFCPYMGTNFMPSLVRIT